MSGDIAPYLALVTGQHRDKASFVETLTTLLRPLADNAALIGGMPALYDIDDAVGQQLDVVGEWVGRSRALSVPLTGVYFSFDDAELGFDQGTWLGPYDPVTGLVSLPDDTYRTLLKATVAANQWDGTVPGAYAIWTIIFGETQVLIQDGGDMTMLFGIIGPALDAVTSALLTGGYLALKPAGVQIVGYLTPSIEDTAFFGFDAETDAVAGFDTGSWGQPLSQS